MRKRRRGFTLIEVAVVLAVLTVVSYSGLQMFDQLNRSYRRAIAVSDLKTQSLAVVAKVQSAARQSKTVKIDPDQRGSRFGPTYLRWEDDTVTLRHDGSHTQVLKNVRQFSFHRRENIVYLTLDVEAPGNTKVHYRTVTPLAGDAR